MDKGKIKNAIRELLEAIGENPDREELKKTPQRIADMLEFMLPEKRKNVKDVLEVTYDLKHDEMVLIKDVRFYSICEHHLLPFFGKCHIAYIPEGNKIVGISKLAEVIGIMSRKLQIQERLTTEIANNVMSYLKPKGVAVVIEARHLCTEMMGLKQQGATIITSAVRGQFRKDLRTREEFLKLIN